MKIRQCHHSVVNLIKNSFIIKLGHFKGIAEYNSHYDVPFLLGDNYI